MCIVKSSIQINLSLILYEQTMLTVEKKEVKILFFFLSLGCLLPYFPVFELCGGSGGVGVFVYQGRRFPGCSGVRVRTPPAFHRSRRQQGLSGRGQVMVNTSEQCRMGIFKSQKNDTPLDSISQSHSLCSKC